MDTPVKVASPRSLYAKDSLLLIAGTDDQVWPSSLLADIAVRRLHDRAHPFLVEHARYEGGGTRSGWLGSGRVPTFYQRAGKSRHFPCLGLRIDKNPTDVIHEN